MRNITMKMLQVATISLDSKSYQLQENLSLALSLAKNARDKGARLIVLPELFDSGYCVQASDSDFAIDFNKPNDSQTLMQMLEFARNYQVFLVGCCIEKDSDSLYDTAFIISPTKGLIGKYRKIYLWGGEVERFARGKEYPIFTLDFEEFSVKVGLQICYEIGFSEGARILSLQGAELLICPAAFGRVRTYAWDLANRARALENGVFVLASNQSGEEFNPATQEILAFAGKSKIINPQGEVLQETCKLNDIAMAYLDIEEVAKQRKAIPYLKDLDISLLQQSLANIHKAHLNGGFAN